ncbi:conserved hypothetical protein [Ricinus communis]|uniref:Uncharacterized protein n=1 Tax=Ricinus communis TaxID=3988 RepID=B9S6M9_RICCO|nr:conserved hypothetical protein [Ricinus communis]
MGVKKSSQPRSSIVLAAIAVVVAGGYADKQTGVEQAKIMMSHHLVRLIRRHAIWHWSSSPNNTCYRRLAMPVLIHVIVPKTTYFSPPILFSSFFLLTPISPHLSLAVLAASPFLAIFQPPEAGV